MDDSRSAAASVPRVGAKGPDPLIGRVINERYTVVSVIARGGMGKVYRAEQAALGRQVALKVLDPAQRGEDDSEFHHRFFLEASLTSKLTHPNTVTIFDYGKTDDDVYYIAMELLEGRTLHRALRDEGPFSAERTVQIATQISRALREAHGLGILHRDLKPANVFVMRHGDDSDFVKVLDFGLVKNMEEKADDQLTKTGVFLGSPKYMAPEQIRGETIDSRSDIYALGVLMFEMLTGKVPFEGPTSVNTLMAHLHEPVPSMSATHPNAQVPAALEDVVRRCLAKQPNDRYASMNDVMIGMKQAMGQAPLLSGEFRTVDTGAQKLPLSDTQSGSRAYGSLSEPSSSGSATRAPSPFAEAAKSHGNSAPLFLAAVFALTGIVGLVVLSGKFELGQSNQVASAPTPAQTQTQTEPVAPPVQNKAVLISLRSQPPGATVIVDEREYGPTPTHVLLTGTAAAPGRQVNFIFQRRGYRDVVVTRALDATRIDVDAGRMESLRRATQPAGIAQPASADALP